MIITKVKISESSGVAINYTEVAKFARKKDETAEKDTLTLTSEDAPTPEFSAAMQTIDRHFADMLGLKDDAMPATLRINSITISMDKDGNESVTISASKPIIASNSPVNMTMSNVSEERWSDGMRQCIEAIRKHAEAYVNGERAQPSFDFRDAAGSDDEKSVEAVETAAAVGIKTIGRRGRHAAKNNGDAVSEQRFDA